MSNLIPFPTNTAPVPVQLHRDTDDDRLEEPRSRVAFAPRPALADPLAPGSRFLAHFGASLGIQTPQPPAIRHTFTERRSA